MKVSLTEEQISRVKSKLTYESLLDQIVFKLSLITEDGKTEPDMEWDFTNVKKEIDLAKKWVQTKEDAEEFIGKLIEKLKNIPKETKKKVLKYALFSLIGLISIHKIKDYLDPPLQQITKVEKQVAPKEIKIRKSSDSLIDHLKYEEGSIKDKGQPVLVAYNLGDGAYTIGYGHAIFPREEEGFEFLPPYRKIIPNKTRITKQQAEILLKDDLREAESIVNRILDEWQEEGINPKITQGMYDAMVSMSFNMGSNIRKSEFIQAVKRGDFKLAKKLILKTSENMFDDYPGLKTRREKEYKMFNS